MTSLIETDAEFWRFQGAHNRVFVVSLSLHPVGQASQRKCVSCVTFTGGQPETQLSADPMWWSGCRWLKINKRYVNRLHIQHELQNTGAPPSSSPRACVRAGQLVVMADTADSRFLWASLHGNGLHFFVFTYEETSFCLVALSVSAVEGTRRKLLYAPVWVISFSGNVLNGNAKMCLLSNSSTKIIDSLLEVSKQYGHETCVIIILVSIS